MTFRLLTALCGVLTVVSLAVRIPLAQEHAPHWGYDGSLGPEHWAEIDKNFASCQQGHHQSPIDIHPTKTATLPPIQFSYRPTPLHLINNGHTIQVNYAPGSFMTVGGKRYELKQLHFHHPSEERIDGKGYVMTTHLVHADAAGNLAVAAVLLDVGKQNAVIDRIWHYLPVHEGPEAKHDDITIDAAGLLPTDHHYYQFTGSLTTPPCTENVTWFVLRTPTAISQPEADAFGKLFPLNARPIQPLYEREVLASK